MPFNLEKYTTIKNELPSSKIDIVAVSKTKSVEDIQEAYDAGIRDFGENYVQELIGKYEILPKDIRWHFIGHLQSNKVKYIAPFVHLIHGVDSEKLLLEINKQAKKNQKKINCLLQVYIASEETKFGFDKTELELLIRNYFSLKKSEAVENINILGLMGMASFTDDLSIVESEFSYLKTIYDTTRNFSTTNFNLSILSMGMSSDYQIAIKHGSNMIRIGSLLFGERH